MKLLACSPEAIDIEALIRNAVQGDYVYMYPPRQAYTPLRPDLLTDSIERSLAGTRGEQVNLYLHFPFCRQTCSFCNLYTVVQRSHDLQKAYVAALKLEMRKWEPLLEGRSVATIYLGGGTPSILAPHLIGECLEAIAASFPNALSTASEVAMEIAPDTVDGQKLRDYRAAGVSRVNLGLQTASDEGLRQIGRRHDFALAQTAIAEALRVGFDNVCVDLIYGLPGQDAIDWQRSIERVIELHPQTVCAYPLTVRPRTLYGRLNTIVDGRSQYEKYEICKRALTGAGYAQETHVRYIQPGAGGYQQKANHWACQDVVGLGAGARGYLRQCDYRNGYSRIKRDRALSQYIQRTLNAHPAYDQGFLLDLDEQLRRRIILGLLDLDLEQLRKEFGAISVEPFERKFERLETGGLMTATDKGVKLTSSGIKYRDLIAQQFFSRPVWESIARYSYDD